MPAQDGQGRFRWCACRLRQPTAAMRPGCGPPTRRPAYLTAASRLPAAQPRRPPAPRQRAPRRGRKSGRAVRLRKLNLRRRDDAAPARSAASGRRRAAAGPCAEGPPGLSAGGDRRARIGGRGVDPPGPSGGGSAGGGQEAEHRRRPGLGAGLAPARSAGRGQEGDGLPAGSAGRRTVKVLPRPGPSLSAQIRPRCSSTMPRQMARPRPVPRVRAARRSAG